MFEESLISAKMAKEPRKRKTYLSLAFLVHGFGFLAMLFFQYWNVEALPEPPIQVSFFTALQAPPPPPRPEPPPPPAPEPLTKPNQPPAAPVVPVQPTVVPDAAPQHDDTVRLTDVLPVPDAPPSNGGGNPNPGPPGNGPAVADPAAGVLVVGGDVKKPVAIYQPQPQYPEIARRARVQGVVIVEAIIDKNGNVTDVQLRKGLPYGLSEAALKAVSQWKFKPATLGDQPVAVFYSLTVRFALQ